MGEELSFIWKGEECTVKDVDNFARFLGENREFAEALKESIETDIETYQALINLTEKNCLVSSRGYRRLSKEEAIRDCENNINRSKSLLQIISNRITMARSNKGVLI